MNAFFDAPLWLFGVALAPFVWIVGARLDRSRARRLEREVGARTRALAHELDPRSRARRRTFAAAALALTCLALAEPRFGTAREPAQGAIDLVIALDVSRSMLARDPAPSRFERALVELEDLFGRAAGERAALVVFAGDAELAVPLTHDLASVLTIARGIDPEGALRGGSDPAAALELCLATLQSRRSDEGLAPPPAAVVLVTDGEDTEGGAAEVAARLREQGFPVSCLGFGSVGGGKIPVEVAGEVAFLADDAGREVVTRLDAAALQRIATAGGGEVLVASAHPRPLVELYGASILPGAHRAWDGAAAEERAARFQLPLLAAFLLGMLVLCGNERRRAR